MSKNHPNIFPQSSYPITQKSWGHEEEIQNSPLYCGKKLVITPGQSSSLHFHIKKTETIYAAKGCLTIELIENKIKNLYRIDAGGSILITPGMIHRLMNTETIDLELFEFSTQSFDTDSYRIE